MKTSILDVLLGALALALLMVLFIPVLLIGCIQFVRDKRTGVWK